LVITVSLSGNSTGRGRKNVQTSAGVPYVLYSTGGLLTMAKISGGSSADQDNAGRPPNTPVGFACAINASNIIGVVWWDSGNSRYSYTTFDTSTDLWSGVIEIIQAQIFGTPNRQIVIAIDANDDPHVGFNENTASGVVDMRYSNRISGSWKTPVVEVTENIAGSLIPGDIIIAIPTTAIGADRPIISYGVSTGSDSHVNHGNALDATGFATRFSVNGSTVTSIATDSDNFVHFAYQNNSLRYRTHDPADVWGTWSAETVVDADSVKSEAIRIATRGTDVHIISVNSSGTDDEQQQQQQQLYNQKGSGTNRWNISPNQV